MSRLHPARPRRVCLRPSLALAALLLLVPLLAACGNANDDAPADGGDGDAGIGLVRFGTDPTFPPLEYLDGSELKGAEIELARAAVERQGGEARFVRGAFDTLIPSLRAGRSDALAAGTYDRTTRRENMQFVRFMREVGLGALFRAGEAPPDDGYEHLCGLTVASGAGTGAEKRVKQFAADCDVPPRLVVMPDESAAQLAVQSGRADAFVTGFLAVSHIAKTAGGGTTFEAVAYPDPPGTQTVYYSFAVPGDDERLAQALQDGLQQLIDDGTYRDVMERYGLGDVMLDRAERVSAREAIARCDAVETCNPDA